MGIGIAIAGAVAGTATKAYGAKKSADAQRAQIEAQQKANEYNAKIYDKNAKLLYEQADDVLVEGNIQEEKFRKMIEGVKGKQRASFGASGAVVDEGSSMDVLQDTAALGEQDALTLRANAYKRYKETRNQGDVQREQSKLLRMGGTAKAPSSAMAVGSTLLSGASQVGGLVGKWKWS